MMKGVGIAVILFVATGCAVILAPSVEAEACYEAWSRCTEWSSPGTGILWKSCAGRCRLCVGRASGSCVQVNGKCGAKTQCQCSGGNVPKSKNWRDILTCRAGL